MSTVLVFDELGVGQQVSLSTNDRGTISGQGADTSSFAGASLGFIAAPAGNVSFNGDGSSGAQKLSAITTVGVTNVTDTRTWNFLHSGGIPTGALVFFSIVGFNAGAITIQNAGVDLITVDSTNNDAGTASPSDPLFPGLVYDGDEVDARVLDRD